MRKHHISKIFQLLREYYYYYYHFSNFDHGFFFSFILFYNLRRLIYNLRYFFINNYRLDQYILEDLLKYIKKIFFDKKS